MASYAEDVKNELARIFDEDETCNVVELGALLRVGAKFFDGRADFENSNAAVSRKVLKLVKKIFPDVRTEVAAIRTKKLRKTMRYVVRIFFPEDKENFLEKIFSHSKRKRNYNVARLRGAFLAGGSVNRPESGYRMEISSDVEEVAGFAKKIFERLEFSPRLYERGEKFVVFLADFDSVCEFLGMVGAEKSIERYESARNLKDIRISVNRLVNCETANLNAAIDTAQKQLDDIRLLQSAKIKVRKTLQEAIDIRLKNPECSVSELAEKMFITRPGLVYRFRMIHRIAEKIRSETN